MINSNFKSIWSLYVLCVCDFLLMVVNFLYRDIKCGMICLSHAAQHFMNQATFHSTFPLLVKLKYLIIYKKLNNYQINYWVNFHCTYLKLQNCNEFENLLLDPDRHSSQLSVKRISQFRSQVTFQRTLLFFLWQIPLL